MRKLLKFSLTTALLLSLTLPGFLALATYDQAPFKMYVEGVKQKYSDSETFNLKIKGLEDDSSLAEPEEGFNIQVYVDQFKEKENYDGVKNVYGSNAEYNNGYWIDDKIGPFEAGLYRLQISLYCANDEAVCADRYGQASQRTYTYWFETYKTETPDLPNPENSNDDEVGNLIISKVRMEPEKPKVGERVRVWATVENIGKYPVEITQKDRPYLNIIWQSTNKYEMKNLSTETSSNVIQPISCGHTFATNKLLYKAGESFEEELCGSFDYLALTDQTEAMYFQLNLKPNQNASENNYHDNITVCTGNKCTQTENLTCEINLTQCSDLNYFETKQGLIHYQTYNGTTQKVCAIDNNDGTGYVFDYKHYCAEVSDVANDLNLIQTPSIKPLDKKNIVKTDEEKWTKVMELKRSGDMENTEEIPTIGIIDLPSLRKTALNDQPIKIKAVLDQYPENYDSSIPYEPDKIYEFNCDSYAVHKEYLETGAWIQCNNNLYQKFAESYKNEIYPSEDLVYFNILTSDKHPNVSANNYEGASLYVKSAEVYIQSDEIDDYTEELDVYMPKNTDQAQKLYKSLEGKIVLKAEGKGEAYYVSPKTKKLLYLKDGSTAYEIMKQEGLGINEDDFLELMSGTAKGHDLRNRLAGQIVLRVNSHGEAYYVNPNGSVTYMPDGDKAYEIMRYQSLGISDADLATLADIK